VFIEKKKSTVALEGRAIVKKIRLLFPCVVLFSENKYLNNMIKRLQV